MESSPGEDLITERGWIDDFLTYTDDLASTKQFRLWSALSAISIALERRVWLQTRVDTLYPNLFVMLVGPPATGKTLAMKRVEALLRATEKFSLSPTYITGKGLVDHLADSDCRRQVLNCNGSLTSHVLGIMVSDFSEFMPVYDPNLAGILTGLFARFRTEREAAA